MILNIILILKSQIFCFVRVSWKVQWMQSSGLSQIVCVIPITPSGSLGTSTPGTLSKTSQGQERSKDPRRLNGHSQESVFHVPLGCVLGVFKPCICTKVLWCWETKGEGQTPGALTEPLQAELQSLVKGTKQAALL